MNFFIILTCLINIIYIFYQQFKNKQLEEEIRELRRKITKYEL